MARPAGSKNTKPRELDPLLQAVIARLPPSNTVWPIAARAAWLELVERSFDMVYVAHADDMLTLTQKLKRDRDAAFSSANGHAVPAAPDHAFYIDRENYARMSGGERINAVEIDGQLMDLRGEGDLGAIIWADGSTGVLGKVLDIKPA